MQTDNVYQQFKKGKKVKEPFWFKMTKPLARELIKRCIDFPALKHHKIEAYKKDMNNGDWIEGNGDYIPIDFKTDRLTDGQNRLFAFIESDLEELNQLFVFVDFDFNGPRIIIQD